MTGSKMLERLRLIKQTCTCLFILVTLLEPLWYYYLLLRVLLSRFQIFHDALESIGCHLLLEQRLNSIWFCQLSLGDARAYFLSTAKNELGVVSAESIAGEILLIFWELNPYKWLWLQFVASSLQYVNVSDLRDCFFFFFYCSARDCFFIQVAVYYSSLVYYAEDICFPFFWLFRFFFCMFLLGKGHNKNKGSTFGFEGISI